MNCPKCGRKMVKAGKADGANHKVQQRYFCRDCYYHTVKPKGVK